MSPTHKVETPLVEPLLANAGHRPPARTPRKARTRGKAHPKGSPEESREKQRRICAALLEKWVPLATAEALEVHGTLRGKPVIEEDGFETGLKAGAFVLKILERLARLDGLDAAEKKELTLTEHADPLELAHRIRMVSPVLMARLEQARQALP